MVCLIRHQGRSWLPLRLPAAMLQSPVHRVWLSRSIPAPHCHELTAFLVTGASSGFGRALCGLVLKNGESVVAAARRTHMLDNLVRQYSADRILVVRMDVTQPHDVSHVFSRAKGAFGHVDVVFNNAGYGGLGEVESVQDADARGLLETNFWGAVSITREAINFFRESNPSGAGGLFSRCLPCLESPAHPAWLSIPRQNMVSILRIYNGVAGIHRTTLA